MLFWIAGMDQINSPFYPFQHGREEGKIIYMFSIYGSVY